MFHTPRHQDKVEITCINAQHTTSYIHIHCQTEKFPNLICEHVVRFKLCQFIILTKFINLNNKSVALGVLTTKIQIHITTMHI